MNSGADTRAIENILFWIFVQLCGEIKITMPGTGMSLIN